MSAPDTHTHVIPWFTRRDAQGRQETVCGLYVALAQVAPTEGIPTCWGCRVWVDQVGRPQTAA